MEFLLKMPKKKRKHANPNFTTSSKIAILIITSLMVLEEFSVDRSNPSSSRNCGLGIWFWRSYLIRDIISGLLLFLKINTGDVVKFDAEEVPLKRSV
jgi:hypothetical protein